MFLRSGGGGSFSTYAGLSGPTRKDRVYHVTVVIPEELGRVRCGGLIGSSGKVCLKK